MQTDLKSAIKSVCDLEVVSVRIKSKLQFQQMYSKHDLISDIYLINCATVQGEVTFIITSCGCSLIFSNQINSNAKLETLDMVVLSVELRPHVSRLPGAWAPILVKFLYMFTSFCLFTYSN